MIHKHIMVLCRYYTGTIQILNRYYTGTIKVLNRYYTGTKQVLYKQNVLHFYLGLEPRMNIAMQRAKGCCDYEGRTERDLEQLHH